MSDRLIDGEFPRRTYVADDSTRNRVRVARVSLWGVRCWVASELNAHLVTTAVLVLRRILVDDDWAAGDVWFG